MIVVCLRNNLSVYADVIDGDGIIGVFSTYIACDNRHSDVARLLLRAGTGTKSNCWKCKCVALLCGKLLVDICTY